MPGSILQKLKDLVGFVQPRSVFKSFAPYYPFISLQLYFTFSLFDLRFFIRNILQYLKLQFFMHGKVKIYRKRQI